MHLIHDSNIFQSIFGFFGWAQKKKQSSIYDGSAPSTRVFSHWNWDDQKLYLYFFGGGSITDHFSHFDPVASAPILHEYSTKRIAGDRLKHVKTKKQFNAIHSFLLVSDTTSQTLNPDILAIPGAGLAGLCHNMLLKERLFSNITRISRPSQAKQPFYVRRKPMKQLQTWIWMPSPAKRFGPMVPWSEHRWPHCLMGHSWWFHISPIFSLSNIYETCTNILSYITTYVHDFPMIFLWYFPIHDFPMIFPSFPPWKHSQSHQERGGGSLTLLAFARLKLQRPRTDKDVTFSAPFF